MTTLERKIAECRARAKARQSRVHRKAWMRRTKRQKHQAYAILAAGRAKLHGLA